MLQMFLWLAKKFLCPYQSFPVAGGAFPYFEVAPAGCRSVPVAWRPAPDSVLLLDDFFSVPRISCSSASAGRGFILVP
jgi:hypothetical protein